MSPSQGFYAITNPDTLVEFPNDVRSTATATLIVPRLVRHRQSLVYYIQRPAAHQLSFIKESAKDIMHPLLLPIAKKKRPIYPRYVAKHVFGVMIRRSDH